MMVPTDPSVPIEVRRALREAADEIRALAGQIKGAQSQTGTPSKEVDDLKKRISGVEQKPTFLDFNDVMRGSGGAHAIGYAPDPGDTAWDERVLMETGKWDYVLGGIIRMVTRLGLLGDKQYAGEILNVLGSLAITGNVGAAKGYFKDLEVLGSLLGIIETRGYTIYNPSGITATGSIIIPWVAPYPCKVIAVKGYRAGGAGATVNARGGSNPATYISPSDITGLKGWWKADAQTGYVDNDTLTTVVDSSGSGFTLDTLTGAPKYRTGVINGLPAFQSDGNDGISLNNIGGANLISAGASTWFVVLKHSSFAQTCYPVILTETGVTQKQDIRAVVTTGATSAQNYDGNLDGSGALTPTVDTFYIFTLMHSGGNIYIGMSDTRTASLTGVASGNTTLSANDDFSILGNSAANAMNGYVAEVIIYNTDLTETQRKQVESYLANKYNLTIPYSHELSAGGNHLASDLSLTSGSAWMDGGAVQYADYDPGNKLEVLLTSVSGSPSAVSVAVQFLGR